MRLLSLLIAAALLVAAVTGCSGGATQEEAKKPGEGATKIGVMLLGTRDDYGYNQSIYEMTQGIPDATGLEVMLKENVPESAEAESVMEELIAQGCGIIFASSYGHRDPALNVAARHPEVAFYVSNGDAKDNLSALQGCFWDSMYLCGMAAAMSSTTGKLGFVAPFAIPTCISSVNAFELGAQSVNPDAVTSVVFTGSWADPGVQTNAVNSMTDSGIDVIAQFQDSTKTIIELCSRKGIKTLGFHIDAKELAPDAWLTGCKSAWTQHYAQFKAAKEGNYEPVSIRGGFTEGMCDLSSYGSSLTEEQIAVLEAEKAKFVSGEKTTFVGPIYDQAGNKVVEDGYTSTVADVDSYNWLVKGVNGVLG